MILVGANAIAGADDDKNSVCAGASTVCIRIEAGRQIGLATLKGLARAAGIGKE